MRTILIVIILIFIRSLQVFPQESFNPPKLEFQQLNDGLAGNIVNSVIQDHQGYIWVGTNNGLNRFDGTKYELFEHNKNDSTSLPTNRIIDIYEDKDLNLWISTNAGLVRFNRDNNNFEKLSAGALDKLSIEERNILCMIGDDDKHLWLGTDNGLLQFNTETKEIENFPINHVDENIADNSVFTINLDNKGRLWLGTKSGINLLYVNEKKIVTPKDENGNGLGSWQVNDICIDSKGNIWIGTLKNGLFQLQETEEGVFRVNNFIHDGSNAHSLAKNMVLKILEDSKKRLWVGTENGGLCYFDPAANKFHTYCHDPTDGTSIKSNTTRDMFEDREGRLWIGTNNAGINLFDPYHRKFYHEWRSPSQNDGLKHNSATSFLEVEDELWIGSDGGGITIWNRNKDSYRYLENEPGNEKSLGSNAVLSIFKDSGGTIWVGTWAGGLNRYDPISQSFQRFTNNPEDPNSISSNNIFDIDEDSKGGIWVTALGGGLCRLDKKTGKFLRVNPGTEEVNGLSSTHIYYQVIDTKGQIWITSGEGLNRVSKKTDGSYHVTHFRASEEDANSLSSRWVQSIFMDSKGRIWSGTDGGLNLFISDEKGFLVFNKSDGLPSDIVKGIIEDELGNFWITTTKGISKMTENEDGTFHFRNYDKSDGLQGDEYLMNSCYLNKKGEIFLGGGNGFNYFNPSKLVDNPFEPNVLLTSFKLFNKEVEIGNENSPLTKYISRTKEIILTYEQSVFSFGFTALNLTHAEKNQYAYILEGLEKNWNFVGSERKVSYTNLDAGEYFFKVKASNNDGLWNEEGISLKIIVLPPWWETWWARTTALLIVIGIAITYYRYKTYKLKKNQEVLEHLVEERTSEVKKQAKELQQRSEEITSQNEELQQQAEELEVQRDNLNEANKAITLKNEMITDSINYAKRIQEAILPSTEELQKALGDHFVLFRPKDIVSGDFYWMLQSKEYTFIAVVDCTGHGVPGACMSMMGSSLLNRIVGEMQIHDPAEILMTLDSLVVESLRQKESDNKDGMDLALCRISKTKGGIEVAYAGAKNGLFYYDVKEETILKIKGNRFSIGGVSKKRFTTAGLQQENQATISAKVTPSTINKRFETHALNLDEGSVLYLTTDGVIDQNNADRRRWGSRRLKEVLSSCVNLPIWKQKIIIENQLESYQQDETQRDDIALLGIKL